MYVCSSIKSVIKWMYVIYINNYLLVYILYPFILLVDLDLEMGYICLYLYRTGYISE